ncbi:MAG TPA: DUF6364 family protein [Phycisphaerae bacterium]|nr:DUF6364 family protein [Phycisphaerae bacterium]
MPKLTLSADSEIIDLAKKLARKRGTSVSNMFSQYVRSMESGGRRVSLTPLTRRASGLIRLPHGKSDRQLIQEAITARHGR